ncbi:MAG: hypothetical protein OXF39_08765 [Nitrospira sp.]|nr:hypothetical protein [Nitrospira sp.]
MVEKHTMLNINDISLDTDNPRIKKSLEKFGDKLNAERIHFALRSATEGEKGASSYTQLKDAILASGGVIFPITVINKGNGYVCIDGNTRLAIYKQFLKEGVKGGWSEIKAIVLDNAKQRDIETIRVSAHLVGAREWPAYEKARYLHYLRNSKFMDYGEMIALCGGNKLNIERQIDAYHDMNEYYRDVVDDTAFHIDRFSGFVELQKRSVKEAIFEAGLDLKDFGEWIRDGKIFRLEDVRDLPKVLRDDKAKETFLAGGPRSIEAAVRLLDQQGEKSPGQKSSEITLETASLYQLAEALARRINDLPYSEVRALRDRERDEVEGQIATLESLSARLHRLLEDVSE